MNVSFLLLPVVDVLVVIAVIVVLFVVSLDMFPSLQLLLQFHPHGDGACDGDDDDESGLICLDVSLVESIVNPKMMMVHEYRLVDSTYAISVPLSPLQYLQRLFGAKWAY